MFKDNHIYFLPHDRLQDLIIALNKNHKCIGPQVCDGAIVYDSLTDVSQLPRGAREEQLPGSYKLKTLNSNQFFLWANSMQAIKPLLFKPHETLWYVKKKDGSLHFEPNDQKEKPVAIFGARACDIAAMVIQDKIFTQDKYININYQRRRENLFVVGVDCTYSSDNCFCVSAGGSTEVKDNFDIAMTELEDGFIARFKTDKGKKLLKSLKLKSATEEQQQKAKSLVEKAAKYQTKKLPEVDLKKVLFENLEHKNWDRVAEKCLACGNCTLVCPTCFCHDEFDVPSIDGQTSEHIKAWDSCFTSRFSHLSFGSVRHEIREYYRQWLTHKLGSWFDQFGTSGCVGCGRCITWCPVGIDITREASNICENVKGKKDE